MNISFFKSIPQFYKAAFKEALKFYGLYLLIAFFIFLVFMAQVYWVLDYFRMENYLEIPDHREYETAIESLVTIKEYVVYIPWALACFGAFFKLPPKQFEHVIGAAIMISILSILFSIIKIKLSIIMFPENFAAEFWAEVQKLTFWKVFLLHIAELLINISTMSAVWALSWIWNKFHRAQNIII